MDITTFHDQHPNSENWDVFRYVAEEMSLEEEQQFERRLMIEQPLREQVAKMTMMLADVEHSFHECPASLLRSASACLSLRFKRHIVAAAALIAIATLSVCLNWQSVSPEPSTDLIAVAWAEAIDLEDLELEDLELAEQDQDELGDQSELADLKFDSGEDNWIASVVAATSEDSKSVVN